MRRGILVSASQPLLQDLPGMHAQPHNDAMMRSSCIDSPLTLIVHQHLFIYFLIIFLRCGIDKCLELPRRRSPGMDPKRFEDLLRVLRGAGLVVRAAAEER